MRDIFKVFQGMLIAEPTVIRNRIDIVKLWAHEMNRVYRDRLIDDLDCKEFDKIIKSSVEVFIEEVEDISEIEEDNGFSQLGDMKKKNLFTKRIKKSRNDIAEESNSQDEKSIDVDKIEENKQKNDEKNYLNESGNNKDPIKSAYSVQHSYSININDLGKKSFEDHPLTSGDIRNVPYDKLIFSPIADQDRRK